MTAAAFLFLPDGATGEDYRKCETIRSYSMANAMSWYHFVHTVLKYEVTNDSLYVVTGCDKSSSWRITTEEEDAKSLSLSPQFTTFGAAVRKSTPTGVSPGVNQPQGQCLFIRGFKIMFRKSPPELARLHAGGNSRVSNLKAKDPKRKGSIFSPKVPAWIKNKGGAQREVIPEAKLDLDVVCGYSFRSRAITYLDII